MGAGWYPVSLGRGDLCLPSGRVSVGGCNVAAGVRAGPRAFLLKPLGEHVVLKGDQKQGFLVQSSEHVNNTCHMEEWSGFNALVVKCSTLHNAVCQQPMIYVH